MYHFFKKHLELTGRKPTMSEFAIECAKSKLDIDATKAKLEHCQSMAADIRERMFLLSCKTDAQAYADAKARHDRVVTMTRETVKEAIEYRNYCQAMFGRVNNIVADESGRQEILLRRISTDLCAGHHNAQQTIDELTSFHVPVLNDGRTYKRKAMESLADTLESIEVLINRHSNELRDKQNRMSDIERCMLEADVDPLYWKPGFIVRCIDVDGFPANYQPLVLGREYTILNYLCATAAGSASIQVLDNGSVFSASRFEFVRAGGFSVETGQ